MGKKIGILSLVLSFLNLICVFVSPIRFGFITNYFNLFYYRTFDFLSFNFGDFNSFFFTNTNIINVVLGLLFAIGAWMYHASDYKNFAILRFIYGVILINLVCFLPLSLMHTYSYFFGLPNDFYTDLPQRGPSVTDVILTSVSYAYSIALGIMAYKIINYFNSKLQVKYEEIDYGYSKSKTFIEAKTGIRFVHLLVDNIIFCSIFYTLIRSLLYYDFAAEFLSKFENQFGERFSLFLLICLFRVIYFLFFEGLFRATPAKFLTQTRVCHYDGSEANTQSIVARTFSRLFPLESITFLFGYNLHDNWSATAVFEEGQIDESRASE